MKRHVVPVLEEFLAKRRHVEVAGAGWRGAAQKLQPLVDVARARAACTSAALEFPCCGCAGKKPRRGWTEVELVAEPVGVFEFRPAAGCVETRWHVVFPVGRTEQRFAGCYSDKEQAARAFDSVSRHAGWGMVNRPLAGCGEQSLKEAVQQRLDWAAGMKEFPHAPSGGKWREQELERLLCEAAEGSAWRAAAGAAGGFQQDDHDVAAGNELCWSFQPHANRVRKISPSANPRPCALDTFSDRAKRAKCARSALEYRGDISGQDDQDTTFEFTLRGELRFLQGSWVMNFQPLVAAAIYERFALPNEHGAVVYDSSAGWGGRLLGAFAARNVAKYIGVEPAEKTFKGLAAMREMLLLRERQKHNGFEVQLLNTGSELITQQELPDASVDLAFTSPPYFNLELYSDEASQSHMRFPSFAQWVPGFLRPTLERTFLALRPGGRCLVNIANNKMFLDKGIDLERATREAARAVGFWEEETLVLLKMDGSADNGEPIFVFRKNAE